MTNNIHLIVVPRHEHSMARAIGRTHMQYARRVNRENGWCGHLWANRYHSSPLDTEHFWNAVRYVELNPVRARMVQRAENHPWSSCREHAGLCEPSGLLTVDSPLPGMTRADGWTQWINAGVDEAASNQIRINTLSGRPCGSEEFVKQMEVHLGRLLHKPVMGRPRKGISHDDMTDDLFT